MKPPGVGTAGAAGLARPGRRDPPAADAPSPSGWPRWYRFAWVLSLFVLLVAFAWVRTAVGGPRVVQVFSDAIVAIGAIVAALAVTHTASRIDTSMRRGWRLLAVGVWLEAIGESLWVAFSFLTGAAPYPGVPDLFYLAGYAVIAAGFVNLAVDSRDERPWIRFTLDGVVVATALLTLGWHFVFDPLLEPGLLGDLETWVSIAYPSLGILVASIGFVVGMNARGPRRWSLLLAATGVFAWVVGDIAFAALEIGGTYVYDTLGLFWLLGYLAVALGALHPDATARAVPGESRLYEFSELVFPFLPFSLAMGLVAALGLTNAFDPGDVLFASLVVVALIARQAYIAWEVETLGDELESSERALAKRNEELLLLNRIVRHDIRNDMTVAYGWGSELQRHVDDEGEAMLDRVLRTVQHTSDLTDTLHDLVDGLDPESDPVVEPTPFRSHLRDQLDGCRETFPEATFTTDEIPDVAVRANPLLGSVFQNILANAVRHSDSDDPSVEVTTRCSGDRIQVRIADDGPGVHDERKDAIFGRGEKGLESPGSGLGLYLVDTIVGHYDGDVWIEDNHPRGAVFVVELDLAT